MAGVQVVAADTGDDAKRLFTTTLQSGVNLIRGRPGPAPPPTDEIDWNPSEQALVERRLRYAFVGARETVREQLDAFASETGVDELMVVTNVYEHAARVRSYELIAER
jgi:alkanesulfonate monooxygenase SsuD/methylene tetrahydromethanopterin reductase-like flavin-dependent oxidoreductase (luciferase family)